MKKRKAKTGKINSNLKDLADKVAPTNLFISDALIAATAIVYSMTIVTRNLADFKPTGLQIVNPCISQPIVAWRLQWF